MWGPEGPIAYFGGQAYICAALNYFKINSTMGMAKVFWALMHTL